jgi:hypothetical protein
MIKGSTYSLFNAMRLVVLFVVAVCFSCSKPKPDPTPVLPPVPNPQSTKPSGEIDSYSIDDTLIGYNKSTFGRWFISGTNTLTKVKFGGHENAGNTGGVSTGLLKKDSLFVLSVNSGALRSQMIHVADTITTRLNNEGKAAVRTKMEITDTGGVFIDTPMSVCTAHELLYFNLTRNIIIINTDISCPSPPAGGMFYIVDFGTLPDSSTIPVTPGTPTLFMWKNTLYTVVTLTSTSLVVTYKANDKTGTLVTWRDTFTYK